MTSLAENQTPDGADPAVVQPTELIADTAVPHVTRRTAEICVALLLFLGGVAVLWDSYSVGAGWSEGLGPQTGFFPARIGWLFVPLSLFVLVSALRRPSDEVFVTLPQAKQVLRVLVPLVIFVALIEPLGMYVASALFIAGFMLIVGGSRWFSIPITAVTLPLLAFWVFEIQFQVPLPKGPLESALGY